MARGQEAKLRRRENRKKKDTQEEDATFGETNDDDGIPLPPKMQGGTKSRAPVEESSEDEDDMPILKSKKKTKKSAKEDPPCCGRGGVGGTGLKMGPLILLFILVGTTVLPAIIFASDYVGKYMSKSNVLGQIGFRLGIGSVPKKRVMSFYEKHAPEKLDDVPDILAKHYGEYPILIKKLERKYQDYGYFIGWQQDEAPLTMVKEQVKVLYDTWISQYWNRYAPQVLKTAFRNIKYNLSTLQKKLRKIWKKTLWPMLEPFLGVPKGGEKQKRKDAADARKNMYKEAGTRRKNKDFRDEEED